MHDALIAGQIALTLLLLAGAGSAMEGFARLMHTPLGYDPHNIVSVGIPLHKNALPAWAARAAYFEQLRASVAETPGVTMAAISSNATPPRNGSNLRFELLGKPSTDQQMGSINLVDSGYFPALRIPLLQGRLWNETENQNGAHVAVINQTLARSYFPNGDAIGHSVKLPDIESRPPEVLSAPGIADAWLTIVGIVADARNDGLRNPDQAGRLHSLHTQHERGHPDSGEIGRASPDTDARRREAGERSKSGAADLQQRRGPERLDL